MDSDILIAGGHSSRVIVAPEDQKNVNTLGKTQKYQLMKELKNDLHDLFSQKGFQDVPDCVEFLNYMKNSLPQQRKSPSESATAEGVVGAQLKSLPLADRNSLITLLTHQTTSEDEEPQLSESVLECYPSLRKRSGELLEQKARKIRSDKIDLQFISDFMHNYCR